MMARRKAPILPDALLDQLLAGTDARSALDPGGLLDGLKKAVTDRSLRSVGIFEHLLGDQDIENEWF
jgi:putative transposase